MKIGVFDSGVGGLHIAHAIERAIPDLEILYANDQEHVPYGTRSVDEIHGFVLPILKKLVGDGCQIIVIACNSVTTTLIDRLREELPVPLVGMEPMIKPAAEATKTNTIAVCATPMTLNSDRYAWLKNTYASNTSVIEPDCSEWARMIEDSKINNNKIKESIEQTIKNGADVIVLGCTHYHWIDEEITEIAEGRALVIHPEAAVIEQLKRVLEQLA